jgi:hypothetical protein
VLGKALDDEHEAELLVEGDSAFDVRAREGDLVQVHASARSVRRPDEEMALGRPRLRDLEATVHQGQWHDLDHRIEIEGAVNVRERFAGRSRTEERPQGDPLERKLRRRRLARRRTALPSARADGPC